MADKILNRKQRQINTNPIKQDVGGPFLKGN